MSELRYFKKTRSDEEAGTRVVQIKTDDIRPNRAQPRAEFEQNSIIRLADSIRRYGILQPLAVRPSEMDDVYGYELIAGERRLRAAKMLGYLTVPCVIMEVEDQISAELAMIENLLREDLNMFEQAYGFRRLMESYRLTQEEVARKMSMSQSAVANKLRLLKLSFEEQRMVLENGLSERHARALLRLNDPKLRLTTLQYIVDRRLTVQDSESYIETILQQEQLKRRDIATDRANGSDDVFGEEKDRMNMVQTLRRRVDDWVRGGRNVTMHVENRANSVEIVIQLNK